MHHIHETSDSKSVPCVLFYKFCFAYQTQAPYKLNSASKHLRTFSVFSLIIKPGDHIKLAGTRCRTRYQNKRVSKRSDTQQLTHCISFVFTCALSLVSL